MERKIKKNIFSPSIGFILFFLAFIPLKSEKPKVQIEEQILQGMHYISSQILVEYVQELCSDLYEGRLTGTKGYNTSADWVSKKLEKMGIQPGGDKKTYLQAFPNPYTMVFEGSSVSLHIPITPGNEIQKHYQYEIDFFPGSTSDSGEVTAEVVYVGYGISAPELNFDEYQQVDVKNKIVLMEREVPVSPEKNTLEFKKWRPYSFHQYKVQNAKSHGAIGMLYNYHIANPNCLFIKNLILTYIGSNIINDIFIGTGRDHQQITGEIQKTLKPQSFETKKIFTLRNKTEHHPEGIGYNLIGFSEGSHKILKREAIIIGAHLDHVGRNHLLMPGANDNASGVSVVLGVAEAISKLNFPLNRSVIFIFFGAEEQGVIGSEYYLRHPLIPNKNIIAFINLDGVGRGEKIEALSAKNFPGIWQYFKKINKKYIHRILIDEYSHNLTRPRLDAARFIWKGIPTISFSTFDAPPLPYEIYHNTHDSPEIITPEIMEDLAQLIFISIIEMASY